MLCCHRQLRQCHPTAGPEFVRGFLGHKVASPEHLPAVYWGGGAFYILTRVVLAFGAFVVVMSISLRAVPWMIRKFRRGKDKEE